MSNAQINSRNQNSYILLAVQKIRQGHHWPCHKKSVDSNTSGFVRRLWYFHQWRYCNRRKYIRTYWKIVPVCLLFSLGFVMSGILADSGLQDAKCSILLLDLDCTPAPHYCTRYDYSATRWWRQNCPRRLNSRPRNLVHALYTGNHRNQRNQDCTRHGCIWSGYILRDILRSPLWSPLWHRSQHKTKACNPPRIVDRRSRYRCPPHDCRRLGCRSLHRSRFRPGSCRILGWKIFRCSFPPRS